MRKVEQLKLDFMLMPNLVKKPVISQYPGGPGLVMAIPAKIDPARKEAALRLIDFFSSDDINRESMQINGGAVPVNANVQPSDLPFYQKGKDGNFEDGHLPRLVLSAGNYDRPARRIASRV